MPESAGKAGSNPEKGRSISWALSREVDRSPMSSRRIMLRVGNIGAMGLNGINVGVVAAQAD